MDQYFYKCETCGFVHLVPAYWVSFSPDQEMDFPHLNLATGELCEETTLQLMPQE